jgi:transcription elongation factor Elf1
MSNIDAIPTIHCPNCRQPMQTQALQQNYSGTERVEICFPCAGIWFDHLASVQLAPAAVIELFKEISSNRAAAQPVANQLTCPRCGDALELSFDLAKSGRFSYFRCLRGDGRFTPFFQFLREKQFVRSLTPAEIQRVRSQVREIKCSQCGAPIDLENSTQCQYCHAPVSFLDPDAVEKALHTWSDAENRRRKLGDALLQIQLPHADQTAEAPLGHLLAGASQQGTTAAGVGLDLIATGMRAIGRLFEHGS